MDHVANKKNWQLHKLPPKGAAVYLTFIKICCV